MIISASRRTDIPAFFSAWFMNRVRAGYFHRVNPFNSRQVAGFSLRPEHVDAICFWTKDPRPLMAHLAELDQRGYRYYFQFTLNPYDRLFEPLVAPLAERIATFRELSGRLGPDRVIWRYDPVILTSATPVAWHLEQLQRLAEQIGAATRRLVFSFHDRYGRGQGRLQAALQPAGIVLEDIAASDKSVERDELVRGISTIADRFQLLPSTCSEAVELADFGIAHGACIDGRLIQALFGGSPSRARDKHQRPACRCVASVDMGSYNTCRFRCAYCYANFSDSLLANSCRRHDPDSPALLGHDSGELEIRTTLKRPAYRRQPALLGKGSAETGSAGRIGHGKR